MRGAFVSSFICPSFCILLYFAPVSHSSWLSRCILFCVSLLFILSHFALRRTLVLLFIVVFSLISVQGLWSTILWGPWAFLFCSCAHSFWSKEDFPLLTGERYTIRFWNNVFYFYNFLFYWNLIFLFLFILLYCFVLLCLVFYWFYCIAFILFYLLFHLFMYFMISFYFIFILFYYL